MFPLAQAANVANDTDHREPAVAQAGPLKPFLSLIQVDIVEPITLEIFVPLGMYSQSPGSRLFAVEKQAQRKKGMFDFKRDIAAMRALLILELNKSRPLPAKIRKNQSLHSWNPPPYGHGHANSNDGEERRPSDQKKGSS
jgi:hypothetical protein